MPTIELLTEINAPVKRCFDLARSIDLHLISTKHTGERAIAGTTSGLIGLNDTVTWRARHYFIWQTLTSKVTELHSPDYFVDEMVNGAFKSFRHEHFFFTLDDKTIMRDVFTFESPLGIIGKIFNFLTLKAYMTSLLKQRNEVIKQVAESDKWKMNKVL
jgi:ligand-binding SRPBCC domain-containing protein